MRISRIALILVLGTATGCASNVAAPVGSASSAELCCGPSSATVDNSSGAPVGQVDLSNDYNSFQVDISSTAAFTGVKIYVGVPPAAGPDPISSTGDLTLSTVEESFAATNTQSYDIPFTDIGSSCTDELMVVAELYMADGSVDWLTGNNTDWVLRGVPYQYYYACTDSCVPPVVSGCTYTIGYWKNHTDWPVTSLDLGGVTYSADALLKILDAQPKGDASMILAHQLIGAKLNLAGSATDADIQPVIDAADAWLAANEDADGLLPFGTPSHSNPTAITLASQLDDFNNGFTGPGHCGD